MQIRAAFKQDGGYESWKSIGNEKTFSPLLVYMFHLARLSKVTNAPICPEFAIKCDSASESIRRSIRRKESIRGATRKLVWLHLHAQVWFRASILIGKAILCNVTTLKDHRYWNAHFSLSRIKVLWLLIYQKSLLQSLNIFLSNNNKINNYKSVHFMLSNKSNKEKSNLTYKNEKFYSHKLLK